MRKTVSIFLIFVLICGLFSLAACEDNTDTSSEPHDDPVHTHTVFNYDPSYDTTVREYFAEQHYDVLISATYTGDYSVKDDTITLCFEVTNNFWGDFEGDYFCLKDGNTCPACLEETFKGDTVQLFDIDGKTRDPLFEKGKEYIFLARLVSEDGDLPCLSGYTAAPLENHGFYNIVPYIENEAMDKIMQAELLHPDGTNGYYHLADYLGTYFENGLEEFEEYYIYDY